MPHFRYNGDTKPCCFHVFNSRAWSLVYEFIVLSPWKNVPRRLDVVTKGPVSTDLLAAQCCSQIIPMWSVVCFKIRGKILVTSLEMISVYFMFCLFSTNLLPVCFHAACETKNKTSCEECLKNVSVRNKMAFSRFTCSPPCLCVRVRLKDKEMSQVEEV